MNDRDSYDEDRSDDDTIDGSTDDEQNTVEDPTDTPNNAPSNNSTMAAILAAVENDPMLDDPNQYAPQDDDDISFCDESIGEIAGIMITVMSPTAEGDAESDDDSMDSGIPYRQRSYIRYRTQYHWRMLLHQKRCQDGENHIAVIIL